MLLWYCATTGKKKTTTKQKNPIFTSHNLSPKYEKGYKQIGEKDTDTEVKRKDTDWWVQKKKIQFERQEINSYIANDFSKISKLEV